MLELMLLQEIFYSYNNDVDYNEFLSKNYNIEKNNIRKQVLIIDITFKIVVYYCS